MRKIIFPLVAALAALVAAGCAGPEQKLGLGLSNTWELARWGEMRSSIEQSVVLDTPGGGYYGVIHGVDRSIARAGIGVFQVATFPFPPYEPIATRYFSPEPAFPLSYKPGRISDPLLDTDTYTGFSGGDVAPFIIGSRFQVFDN
jgi:putative exosortase-associated protein (TIGR04073 family)